MPGPHRLLIIGIGGADYHALTNWIGRGKLPSLTELMSRGRLLRCQSTRPPVTAPAWTTVLTGCEPGKHGIYDFIDFSSPDRRPWWTIPRGCPDLFERLSAASLSCGGLSVPMIYPAREPQGVMVSGFGSPGLVDAAFYPRSLRDELLTAVPEYEVYPRSTCCIGDDPEQLVAFPRVLGRAAAHVLDQHDLDVFMLVFSSLDWAGHAHMGGPAPLEGVPLAVAEVIDEEIGRLVGTTEWPKTPVLIISDHGMRCARRQLNLPKLFVDLGLMRVRWADTAPPIRRHAVPALASAWRLAKRILPPGVVRRIRVAGDSVRRELTEGWPSVEIDWEGTTAFPLGSYGSIQLNLQGREPHGTVTPKDYERVRAEVIGKLQSATDPASGEPLFGEVPCGEEAFGGPLIGSPPDIVVSAYAEDVSLGIAALETHLMLFTEHRGLIEPMRPPWGVHTPDAILGISGDAVNSRAAAPECSLADFAPTALHLLGLPVPTLMDGRALTECLTGSFGENPGPAMEHALFAPQPAFLAYSREDEQVLTARLHDLGYL